MTTYKEKQTGFAPIIIVLVVVIGIGAIVGGGYYIKNKRSKTLGANISKVLQEESGQRRGLWTDEFLAGTIEDLVIGEEVMVRGTANQDGSITAEMIFIGAIEKGLRNMRDFSPEPGNMKENTNRPFLPEGFNPEEFRNLSQEERMERMRGMVRRNPGAGFVRGEIIDKDEMSITVKLTEGGSRLVFYSDSTRIMKGE